MSRRAPEPDVVRLTVLAKPRAKKSRITRAVALEIDVQLAAPPVDGAANEELVSVLADALSLPRRGLRVAMGASSRRKVVEVTGLPEAEVRARLLLAVS